MGVSRLTVRDAVARGVLPGRRDNRGHLRVDLSGGAADLIERLRAAGAPSAGAVDGLFDEIEELTDALAERDARLARAEGLLARQAEAMDRALEALEARDGPPESAGVPAGLAERTLAALERAVARLEASEGRERRLLALLDRAGLSGEGGPLARAVEAAEAARARAAERGARLAETEAALERALALGERALAASEGRPGRWRLFRRRGEGR